MALTLGSYTPPAPKESGDNYKPSEHVGSVLIVKVLEHKTGIVTQYKPDGGDGVTLDICDLTAKGETYTDVLWMNGALVDGLKEYAGKGPLVITLAWRTGSSGRDYLAIEPATEKQLTAAQKWVNDNGDPFAPTLGVPAQAQSDEDQPPF